MSILLNKHTRVLVQGITGKIGQAQTKWMKEYGTTIVAGVLSPEMEVVRFSIRNTLARLISEGEDKAALVLRFGNEGSSIRRAEFHTSASADSLKPALTFTYSTAPTFPK